MGQYRHSNKNLLGDPRLRLFVNAIENATQYLINHPQESWKVFINAYKDLDDELNKRAWAATLPRFALRPAALDKLRYTKFADFLKEKKIIKRIPKLDSYAIELP